MFRAGWAPCISDVAPRGGFPGAYLMSVPSMGLPVPLPDLLSITETPHIPFGRGGVWVVVGIGCATSAPVVTSRDPKIKVVSL
jgi:hypothetical protein